MNWRTNAVFLCAVACWGGCRAAKPAAELIECNRAASEPPRQHLTVCAALFRATACRKAFTPPPEPERYTPDVDAIMDACAPVYCSRLQSASYCSERSWQALAQLTGAALSLEHGASARAATEGFASAFERVVADARATEQKRLSHGRLRLVVTPGVRVQAFDSANELRTEWSGERPTANDCDLVIQKALAGPVGHDDVASVSSDRSVQFGAIRCLIDALQRRGFAAGNIGIATSQAAQDDN